MFHDFYNNYEQGESVYIRPNCANEFRASADAGFAECPYCGKKTKFKNFNRKNINAMKTTIHSLLALLVLFLCSTNLAAQSISDESYRTIAHVKADGTVQDGSYRTIGHIKADGTVQDASYKTIARIKSDGTIQAASYSTLGHIKGDGTVQDVSYRTIGHIKADGTVQDASYRTIGHAKGIPVAWVAYYFFFMSD